MENELNDNIKENELNNNIKENLEQLIIKLIDENQLLEKKYSNIKKKISC